MELRDKIEASESGPAREPETGGNGRSGRPRRSPRQQLHLRRPHRRARSRHGHRLVRREPRRPRPQRHRHRGADRHHGAGRRVRHRERVGRGERLRPDDLRPPCGRDDHVLRPPFGAQRRRQRVREGGTEDRRGRLHRQLHRAARALRGPPERRGRGSEPVSPGQPHGVRRHRRGDQRADARGRRRDRRRDAGGAGRGVRQGTGGAEAPAAEATATTAVPVDEVAAEAPPAAAAPPAEAPAPGRRGARARPEAPAPPVAEAPAPVAEAEVAEPPAEAAVEAPAPAPAPVVEAPAPAAKRRLRRRTGPRGARRRGRGRGRPSRPPKRPPPRRPRRPWTRLPRPPGASWRRKFGGIGPGAAGSPRRSDCRRTDAARRCSGVTPALSGGWGGRLGGASTRRVPARCPVRVSSAHEQMDRWANLFSPTNVHGVNTARTSPSLSDRRPRARTPRRRTDRGCAPLRSARWRRRAPRRGGPPASGRRP